jgi:transposase
LRALGLARQIAAKDAEPDVPAMAMQVIGLLCGQVLDTHVRLQAIDRSIGARVSMQLRTFSHLNSSL